MKTTAWDCGTAGNYPALRAITNYQALKMHTVCHLQWYLPEAQNSWKLRQEEYKFKPMMAQISTQQKQYPRGKQRTAIKMKRRAPGAAQV